MKKHDWRTTTLTLAGYALWAVSSVIGVGVALVARDLLVKLYLLLLPSPWSINAVDKVVVIGCLLCWIVLSLLCQQYYLRGAREGKLWRRFALVTLPSLAVLGIGYVLGSFG
jgi:hypothetical protein